MTREQARQQIRSEWRQIIPTITAPAKQRVNNETSFICPFCGHGSHGDGMTVNKHSADGNGLKCFGCGWSGDIIDLYQQTAHADYNTALNSLSDMIDITIDTSGAQKPTAANIGGYPAIDTTPHKENATEAAETATETDYTAYYIQCTNRINDPTAIAYLSSRGIDINNAAAYMVGYDPAADPANAPGALTEAEKLHPSPRIIIPTSKAHYVSRSVDNSTNKKYKYINPNSAKGAGAAGIFNRSALYSNKSHEIFVTEGAFNALSIIEAGAEAIATNSASNTEILLKALEKRPTNATLIIAFDNDTAGRSAAEKLRTGLKKLNIAFIDAGTDVTGAGDQSSGEDANSLLIENRAAFIDAVRRTRHRAAARPDNVSYYIDNIMTEDIGRFKSNIYTGFKDLDKKAGGIYAGLYVIAAISSLGKTTFTAQMCDQIAASGNDVLFFSMEQSRLEMVSKSIARKTFINDPNAAVSSLSIRKGYITDAVMKAAAQYKQEVRERISVIEGNFDCDIRYIASYIRKYINKNNTRPVVVLDYLQVLQPDEELEFRQSSKEIVDTCVTELKRISREFDLPIFIISSVNRANYLTPIDFESLKESGSIEYTADVIWGLQLQCLHDPIFDKQNNIKERREKVKEAKSAMPRQIELVCLKNRYGIANYSAFFNYYPANDYFEECTANGLENLPPKSVKRI